MVSNGDCKAFTNLAVEPFSVSINLFIGYFGINLSGIHPCMSQHLADRFQWYTMRESNLCSVCMSGRMESDRLRKEKQTEED